MNPIKIDFDNMYIGDKPPSWTTRTKDPRTSGLEDMPDSLYRHDPERICEVIDRIDQIGLPRPNQQYRLITRRVFNAIEMLIYVCQQETVTDLKMAVYSINYKAAQILLQLIDTNKIEKAEIMMSNLRNAAHREKEEIIKNAFATHPKISVWFCSSHAKLMACTTDQGNHYVIEGSGNHSYNSRIEQYVIDNNEKVYQFTSGWMNDIKNHLKGKKELVIL